MPRTTPSPGATRPAILVVDDHSANQIAFDAVLAPGHSVVSASSGSEALGRVHRDDFALILLGRGSTFTVELPLRSGVT